MERITFQLGAATKAALEARAEAERRSVSNLVEKIVTEALAREPEQKRRRA